MKEPNHSSRGRHNIRYWQWHTRYFRISKLTFYVLGAIVNYASHIMCVAVNYLASNRPFNFTAYCRHDIQVTEIVLFLRSLFTSMKVFQLMFTPVFSGKSTTYGKYRNHNHALLRSNVA